MLHAHITRIYRESGLRGIAERGWQFFIAQSFSSLTRRIVSLNVAGLVALVVGTMYLSQFRAGLIEARVQSLVVQGEIIAGAIAASATSDAYGSYGDRDRTLDLPPIENYTDDGLTGLEFSINPERVAPILRRLISPTKTRARIYDRNGYLDSRQPQPLHPGRSASPRPAAAEREEAELLQARLERRESVARPRRSSALPRTRSGSGQGLSRGRAGAVGRAERLSRAHHRCGRGHRLGRGAGAALPRGARRAGAVDARRRHQPGGRGRARPDLQAVPDPARGHGGAVGVLCAHHRQPDEAAGRERRARPPPHPLARGNSRSDCAAATKSAICPARCAT